MLLTMRAKVMAPRMLAYAIRNHTGDRVDDYMGMPMHRGLGPHLRGTTPTVRGLGAIASPNAFGHGGVGTSYCWGDPDSGVRLHHQQPPARPLAFGAPRCGEHAGARRDPLSGQARPGAVGPAAGR